VHVSVMGKTNARKINSHVALLKLPIKIAQRKPEKDQIARDSVEPPQLLSSLFTLSSLK